MKKIWGLVGLVTACLLFAAADNGVRTRSAPGVYDANGQFIGTLVDGSSLNDHHVSVYVPSLHKVVEFDETGKVISVNLFFTSTDCSGTPYTTVSVLDSSILRQYRSGLYTIKSVGNPLPNLLNARSEYYRGCNLEYTHIGGTDTAVALVPFNEPLPFTVPLAQPLVLK